MASVEFDVTTGSPRMTRSTNVPSNNTCTIICFVKVTSYENFGAIASFRHANTNAAEFWFDSGGILYGSYNFTGDVQMFTGTNTGWLKLAATGEAESGSTRWRLFYQTWNGTFTTGTTILGANSNFTLMRFGSNDDFNNDINGITRYAGIKVWNSTLTSGQIQTEFASRSPVITSNLVFYNDCTSAATVNVDNSSIAQNFTLTGTPTTQSADDPWDTFTPILPAITRPTIISPLINRTQLAFVPLVSAPALTPLTWLGPALNPRALEPVRNATQVIAPPTDTRAGAPLLAWSLPVPRPPGPPQQPTRDRVSNFYEAWLGPESLSWETTTPRFNQIFPRIQRSSIIEPVFLTSVGAIVGSTTITFSQTSTLTGVGALVGTDTITLTNTGTLTGTGEIAATVTATINTNGTLTGTGALTGTDTITFASTSALTGTGALVGTSTIAVASTGTLVGTGTMDATSTIALSVSGTLQSDGALAGTDVISITSTGALVGVGALNATSTITIVTTGTLQADGALVGSSTLTITTTGALAGVGALATTTSFSFDSTGTLTGIGDIATATSFVLSQTGTLVGTGALVGSSTIIFDQTAALIDGNSPSGFTAFSITTNGALVGDAALSANTNIAVSTSATLTGTLSATGDSTIAFVPTAVLTGVGALIGSSIDVIFTGTATLSALNSLIGTANMALAVAGSLVGDGALIGSSTITFAGTLYTQSEISGSATITLNAVIITDASEINGYAQMYFIPSATLTGLGSNLSVIVIHERKWTRPAS